MGNRRFRWCVSAALSPCLERAIYNADAENATAAELWQSVLMGAVVGGVFRGIDAVTGELLSGQNKTASGVEAGKGIVPFSEQEKINLTSPKGVVNGSGTTFRQFIDNAKNLGNAVRFYFGKVSNSLGDKFETETGRDIRGYNIAIRTDEVVHALQGHGNAKKEAARGQLPVTADQLERLPEVFDLPDEIVSLPKKDYAGRDAFEFRRWIDGYMIAVVGIAEGKHSIEVDSVRITNKKQPPTTANAAQNVSPGQTSKTGNGQAVSATTLPHPTAEVKTAAAGGRDPFLAALEEDVREDGKAAPEDFGGENDPFLKGFLADLRPDEAEGRLRAPAEDAVSDPNRLESPWENGNIITVKEFSRAAGFGRGEAAAEKSAVAKYSKVRYHADGTVVVTDDWTQRKHPRVPSKYAPNAVIDTLSQNGRQHDRTFFDQNGNQIRQISNGPHGNKQRHPYGQMGEHAHDILWDAGRIVGRPIREITDAERKESADILYECKQVERLD